MKTDKKQLMQAIEALKEKLASMEEELNKAEEFIHFPGKGDEYYFYTATGVICSNTTTNDNLKINVFKSEKEAKEAYNKAVAIEKIKRRLQELQGNWKPDFNSDSSKHLIFYNYNNTRFEGTTHSKVKFTFLIPYMENKEIALTIINEFHEELKLIFDIA